MSEWESGGEVGRYEVIDCMSRCLLLDTVTGKTWWLSGADKGRPQWTPILWPEKCEVKP